MHSSEQTGTHVSALSPKAIGCVHQASDREHEDWVELLKFTEI